MGIGNNWPEYMPTVDIGLTVSSGSMTIAAGSEVKNYSDYGWSPAQLRGTLWKNGSKVRNLLVNSSTGAISMSSALAVSNADLIEARFHVVGKVSDPWGTRLIGTRSCYMTVSGDGTTTFDDSTNTIPVPAFDLTFGWDASDDLKVGVKMTDADGTSRDISLKTRLLGQSLAFESSTTIDVDDLTNVQNHTADFGETEIEVACELEFTFTSADSTPYVKDVTRVVQYAASEISDYDTSFPTTGTLLEITKPVNYWSAELGQP